MARPRKFVEDQVIEAARDQFWARGYAGTSLDDLVAATGLGRGSLYGAFGDKHVIFMRALDEYSTATMAAVLPSLVAAVGEPEPSRAGLETAASAMDRRNMPFAAAWM